MEVGADCGGKGREGIDSEENDLEEGAGRGGGGGEEKPSS